MVKTNLLGLAVGVLALAGFAQPTQAQVTSYVVPSQGSAAPLNVAPRPVVIQSAPITTYSAPTATYSTPTTSYSAPVNAHPAPTYSYSAPTTSYAAPSHSYSVPSHTHAVQAHAAQYHAPRHECSNVHPPATCGFSITHVPGCDCKESCVPLDNTCGNIPEKPVYCPYYEWCKDFLDCVEAPQVLKCVEESFKFGTTTCNYKCCSVTVCVRTHRVEKEVTHCQICLVRDAKLRVCKVKKTGLYDVFALGLPGMPKEIVILHDVTLDQVKQRFQKAPVP